MQQDFSSALVALAKEAGAEIMTCFKAGARVSVKEDLSPVTDADRAAEEIILSGLHRLLPGVPCVAEEHMAQGATVNLSKGDSFFLVDPLDGTREFIAGRNEFTVNIALVEKGAPVLGVVFVPAMATVYYTTPSGVVFRQVGDGEPSRISCREGNLSARVALVSRYHNDHRVNALLKKYNVCETLSIGSSLKFCRLAEGAGDLYPRIGRTMEWDTAAGQAILEAAGGGVLTEDGAPLGYGKPEFENPSFIAWGRLPVT